MKENVSGCFFSEHSVHTYAADFRKHNMSVNGFNK